MTDPAAFCVLIVDPDPDTAAATAEMLRTRGHRARAASTGGEAVVAAADDRPALALVDLGIPVLDGFGLAPWLRQQAPDMLLVAVAERWGAETERQCAAAGFAALLLKPLTSGDLESVLARVRDPG